MENAWIADRLEAFASLLDLADANPYMPRAYRRAAETIRGARGAGRRSWCGPGGCASCAGSARDRGPAARAGGDRRDRGARGARARDLARARRPRPLPRARGERARSRSRGRSACGPPDELRAAAAAGRLRDVPGIGPKREAQLLDALARAGRAATAPQPAPQHRAGSWSAAWRRRSAASRPATRGAGATPASTSPWSAPRRIPRPCSTASPRCRRSSRCSSRTSGAPSGLTVEGVPIELVAAAPERFGTALVRATGSPAYVDALEPLPDAPDEASVLRGPRPPLVPAGAARGGVPRRAAGARRAGRHPRRPPLPHDVVRRPRERRGDGPRRARARLRLRRDLRPHAGRRRRPAA